MSFSMSPFPLQFGTRQGGGGYKIGPFTLSRDLIADGARFAPGVEVGIEKRQDYATTAGGTDLAKIYIWQHLGGHVYAQHKMTDASGANRINWYQTWICELFAYYLADEFTLAGAPSIVNTYYYESLGHIGCKAVSLASAGQSASIELTGHSGDIWLAVEDGPDRGGLWVEIDGEQDLVTLPEIADGVKGIDCYAPSTARAQLVRIASNLPTGDYTVSAGFADVRHPLSTDETVLLEAVATPGRLTNSRIRPPFYESETAYVQGDEVVGPDGWSWHCAAAGTTGETPPTPTTSGEDFADGTATWRRYFNYTYNYRTFQIGESTEREHAGGLVLGDDEGCGGHPSSRRAARPAAVIACRR